MLCCLLEQGKTPDTSLTNASIVTAESPPLQNEAELQASLMPNSTKRHSMKRHSIEPLDKSSSAELAVIKLQLENMQLNLQSANEEVKVVRLKCDKSQDELVTAQVEVGRVKRELEILKHQNSELLARATRAEKNGRECEEQLDALNSEHRNYARMVFRLSKRCYALQQRWSGFPSAYSMRSCLSVWTETVRHRRRVRNGMDAAALRRCYRSKRRTLIDWFRKAAAGKRNGSMKPEISAADSAILGMACERMRDRESRSPQPLRSREQIPSLQLSSTFRGATSPLEVFPSRSSPPSKPPAPLDTLQRLRNAYRPSGTPVASLKWSEGDASIFAQSVKKSSTSSEHSGPLGWFLQVLLSNFLS
jgi:hypothetical protein